MNILLTGAGGFLGSHLARGFLAAGHGLWAIRRPQSNLSRLAPLAERIQWLDQASDGSVCLPAGSLDCVVHCAACYGRQGESLVQLLQANTLFPLGLLQAAQAAGVRHWINSDSALPRDFNAYALSKSQFADWGRRQAAHGIDFINIRLEQMYGPGDDESKFPAYVVNNCLRNVPELRLTAGEQQRDFIYIDDVVSAYLCLLRHVGTRLKGWHEIALGSGVAVSLRQFAESVRRRSASRTHLAFGALDYRPGEIMHSVADLRQMQALGWQPATSLDEGIQHLIKDIAP